MMILILILTNCTMINQISSITTKPFHLKKNIILDSTIQKIVMNMVQTIRIHPDSILLVDCIRNNNKKCLENKNLKKIVEHTLLLNSQFSLISSEQLKKTKLKFGLSLDDNLNSHSKFISLARIMHAQYILYTNIQDDKLPIVQVQLIQLNSGEIIWSGNNVNLQNNIRNNK
ncbi:hypothetical protein [Candidatus Pantoea carbekii]|nr:hypothetical protein [Candidatus Pantoea carbekii]